MSEEVVSGLLQAAYGMAQDASLTPPEIAEIRAATRDVFPYFIAFTARSGSTFLTRELFATGRLSRPEEWFNYTNAKAEPRNVEDGFARAFTGIVKNQRSENGVFGCEINWLQLVALRSIIAPKSLFQHRIRWFYLRRRNVVAQAISNFLADRTNVFHSYQLNEGAPKKIAAVEYDAMAIKRYAAGFIRQERFFDQWFLEENVTPVNLFYEDIVRDPVGTVLLFANVLSVHLPNDIRTARPENPITRMSSSKNLEFEERFRAEEGDFLARQFDLRGPVMDRVKSI